MTILLTGSSRGIGAAIQHALGECRRDRHRPRHRERHSRRLRRPGRPARTVGRGARTRSRRRDRRAGQQCRRVRGEPARRRRLDREMGTDDADQPDRERRCARLAVLHWQARGCGGRIVNVASRAATRVARALALRRVEGGDGGDDQDDSPGYARDGILAFAICPGSR